MVKIIKILKLFQLKEVAFTVEMLKAITSFNYIGLFVCLAALAVFAKYKAFDEKTKQNHKAIKRVAVAAFVVGSFYLLSPLIVKFCSL